MHPIKFLIFFLLFSLQTFANTTPPTATITTPQTNSTLLFQTDITGTASDDNLDFYQLQISPIGEDNYTTFARGENSVSDGVLATLDATTLKNGIYDIRLKVVDKNSQISLAKTTITIKGKAKIGNFSFTITDFDIKVGGIPVQVNRTYSTLQRFENLDFGYAWSIDYQNVKVQESMIPGEEWKNTPDRFGIGFCFKTDKQHLVNISLPDGTTESFEYKFARECGGYRIGSFYDAPLLYAQNGSEAKLETIDASDTMYMNNAGEIIDSSSLLLYNPNSYRLTLSNGMIYDITQNQGITKITDTQTNTLTYTTNGIQSSRGESLTFERDNQGRITKITDLAGKEVTYNYNASNDLSSVTDQIGYTTSYTFMESAQAGVATMAQEVSYLLIAKYAVMQNEINFITGKTR